MHYINLFDILIRNQQLQKFYPVLLLFLYLYEHHLLAEKNR